MKSGSNILRLSPTITVDFIFTRSSFACHWYIYHKPWIPRSWILLTDSVSVPSLPFYFFLLIFPFSFFSVSDFFLSSLLVHLFPYDLLYFFSLRNTSHRHQSKLEYWQAYVQCTKTLLLFYTYISPRFFVERYLPYLIFKTQTTPLIFVKHQAEWYSNLALVTETD